MDCGDPKLLVLLESGLPADVFRSIKEYVISERLDAAKRLAAWFSHEINNPLGTILGSAQLLDRRLQKDIQDTDQLKQYKRYLNTIQTQTERCAQVTVESLSCLELGEPVFRKIDIIEAIYDAIQLVHNSFSDAAVNVNMDTYDIPHVKADRQWLSRIIFELVVNGIESSSNKPIMVAPYYHAVPGEEKILIKVTDAGSGVHEKLRWRIFDPYFSTRERARGLGLTLSLEMANRMSGSLYLEHTNNDGSTFTISLPVPKADD